MRPLTPTYAAVFLLAGLGGACPALAAGTVEEKLGDGETSIDVFEFTCPEEPPKTVSARAKVADINPINAPALMRVRLLKDHKTAVAQDLNPSSTSGEGGAPSPDAVLAEGPGRYLVLFYKTAAGEEKYRGSVVCKRSSGTDYPPGLTNTQDQD